MSFYTLLVWSLLCYSISIIVTGATVFEPLRKKVGEKNDFLGQLLSCPMCFGFWVGIFLNLTLYPITNNFFFDGCLGSGITWLLFSWTQRPSY